MKTTKRYTLGKLCIYEHRFSKESEEQLFFGIPIRRKKFDKGAWCKYLLGICYHRKPILTKFQLKTPNVYNNKYASFRAASPKELLLVPSTGIGDYLMWRNFISELRKSKKYRDYRIAMICDNSIRPFAEYLDRNEIDQLIPYNESLSLFNIDFLQLTRIRNRLSCSGLKKYYHTIIFTSTLFNGQKQLELFSHIVSNIAAEERYGFYSAPQMFKTGALLDYTNVVLSTLDSGKTPVFNLARLFFENIIEKKITLSHPFIRSEEQPSHDGKKYIVVNPYTSKSDVIKRWHINNWVQLLTHIHHGGEYNIVVVCSRDDEKEAIKLQKALKTNAIECSMGISMDVPSLMSTIRGCSCYIGADSGIFHLAASMGVNSVCISSGKTYYRFLALYEQYDNVRVVLPPDWKEWYIRMNEAPSFSYPNENYIFINAVRIKDVVEAVEALMNEKI